MPEKIKIVQYFPEIEERYTKFFGLTGYFWKLVKNYAKTLCATVVGDIKTVKFNFKELQGKRSRRCKICQDIKINDPAAIELHMNGNKGYAVMLQKCCNFINCCILMERERKKKVNYHFKK